MAFEWGKVLEVSKVKLFCCNFVILRNHFCSFRYSHELNIFLQYFCVPFSLSLSSSLPNPNLIKSLVINGSIFISTLFSIMIHYLNILRLILCKSKIFDYEFQDIDCGWKLNVTKHDYNVFRFDCK